MVPYCVETLSKSGMSSYDHRRHSLLRQFGVMPRQLSFFKTTVMKLNWITAILMNENIPAVAALYPLLLALLLV